MKNLVLKYIFGILIFFIPVHVYAEVYFCKYSGYGIFDFGEPGVILKVSIEGDRATLLDVDSQYGKPSTFQVLKNTQYGVVLAKSYSSEDISMPDGYMVAITGFVIDKVKMTMARNNITVRKKDTGLRVGICKDNLKDIKEVNLKN